MQGQPSSRPGHVLVISHDVVGERMAGPGIRYFNLARVLSHHFPTILAAPGSVDCPADGFELWPYQPGQWETLSPAVTGARAILLCGDVLAWFPLLGTCGVPLIMDGYDPHTLETLAMLAGHPEQEQRHAERERILQMQCRAGDFFICASERQRDWWLGLLEATGRVNARTYNDDPSLRRLIDVVPFGLPSKPPHHTRQVLKGVWPGIEAKDKVVLWGGGLWQWLDPLTAIRAVAQIREQRSDVKLVFPGTRHPNPVVTDMPMRQAAIRLAEELGLLDRSVFFGEWVPTDEWPNYLLEADVGLSLHFDTLETRLAFRSRILDYIWAGLPMVVTRGDATSELVMAHGLGLKVDYQDVDGVATAILTLLDEPRSTRERQFAAARAELTWERAARPVVEFCADARYAADRRVSVRGSARSHSMSESQSLSDVSPRRRQFEALEWYHTIDLGNGIVTPGHYDHRPYLPYYGIPEDLTGKTVLDVGAASGFFAFEMERRGAKVAAVDLPQWFDHDFGPCYRPDKSAEEGARYLHEPIMLAKQVLGSQIDRIAMSVYDLSPDTVGMYDLVFCGSLLLHLTDPVRALWRLQSVTREVAIIATVIHPDNCPDPLALFVGHHRGDGWWLPNRACLEAMVKSA
ncbi:MAG: glycosyltransferase, partial [Anaerolineae bacterium]|nr:glycosyltransferase [Anaerolineae bacterium]